MQGSDPALAIERATQALYATASTPREPRAVKTIIVLMAVAVVLLAMVPFLASSMRPDTDSSGPRMAQPATSSEAPVQTSASTQTYYAPNR
jgi:hypothetical protein